MASFSRGLRSFTPRGDFTCSRCLQFSTTPTTQSGHSRWSKIKHDKGSVDAKKSSKNTAFAKEIVLASKLGGPDPNMNPRLAGVLSTAKKAGFTKASMEAAIARGQGRSTSGVALEYVTLEAIMPPSNIATIIEAETDKSMRTLMELRTLVKFHYGTVTPTSYLFDKKGRVAFEKVEGSLSADDVLEEAIEAGAIDVEEDEEGCIVVWTEPNMVTAVAEALHKSHGLKVESSDIIWDPKEDTKIPLESTEAATTLSNFIDSIRDNPSVQGVYANAAQGSLSDEVWEGLESRLDA